MEIVFETQQSQEIVFPIAQGVKGDQGIQGNTGAQGSGVKITPWTAGAYLSGDQVNYLGKDWVSNAATVAGDVPGTSSKWVERLRAYGKKADLVAGKNKFNYADPDILRGKYFEADGSIGIYSGFSISHPIDVVVGNSYTCNKHNGAFNCFFDANDVLIPFPILDNDTMTAPVGAVYLRYSLDLPDAADISLADIQVEEGLTSTTFEPYVVKLNPDQIDLTPYALEENTVNKPEILKLEALSLTLESDNLISKYHLNKWIDVTSVGDNIYDAIDDSDNVYGKVSEPVFINPEKEYSFWYGDIDHQESVVILELDNEKTILTRSSASSNTITPSSAQVVYLCLQYNQGYSGNIAIVEGLTFKNKGDYNPKLSVGGDRLSAVREVNQWLGKKVCTFGNSITQYGFWQDSVIKFFGFGTHYNRGVSSAKVSNIDPFYYWANADGSLHSWISENPTMPVGTHQVWSNYSSDTRIATIPLDSDLIIVMGGTNDAGGIAIGNMIYAGSSFDESVFKGGLAETIRKIQVRCPNAIIVVATPLSGLGSLPNYTPNGNGDTIADFALAVKDVAFRMSIPCIDIFGTCGINPQNRTEYLQVDNVHPTYGNVIADNNGTGSSMIARAMIGGLKNILPKDAMLTFITPPTL